MRMDIKIEVHVPEEYKAFNVHFIERVLETFRQVYPEYETDYRPDGTPHTTVSFFNEDGSPMEMKPIDDK